ncbi:arginase [Litorilinea aerophila]|uniref:Arginase n=1 Tax=Litorilinea aerophila TaxID=1204385 RepID=A0A540VL06_9CHLR|nr:arginase [Litorilinea aerophila]MCC9075139.1 arginase [Litorilinea aerophila]OUC05896.1 arginase [Litorilinea aerophila]GIV78139.1 MAG: arginase [Litorilinea sp.]
MAAIQHHRLRILGIPMDLGQQRRGVDMGPSAVRYAGLYERLRGLGHQVEDAGNVPVPVRHEAAVQARSWTETPEGGLHHLPAVVQACQQIFDAAQASAASQEIPIFLGGDHSIAIGTVSGMATAGPLGLIWVDAHGDFNTPASSPSGNIHGMPVAVLTGRGHPDLVDLGYPGAKLLPQHIVLVGVRSLDPEERVALAGSGINVYTMRDIDELGMATVARRALSRLSSLARIHVSIDMDAIEPAVAPGVGTPVAGGLTFREAHLLMEILAESEKVRSVDVVEINPILDEGNRTAELAVELIASLLGQRIL